MSLKEKGGGGSPINYMQYYLLVMAKLNFQAKIFLKTINLNLCTYIMYENYCYLLLVFTKVVLQIYFIDPNFLIYFK